MRVNGDDDGGGRCFGTAAAIADQIVRGCTATAEARPRPCPQTPGQGHAEFLAWYALRRLSVSPVVLRTRSSPAGLALPGQLRWDPNPYTTRRGLPVLPASCQTFLVISRDWRAIAGPPLPTIAPLPQRAIRWIAFGEYPAISSSGPSCWTGTGPTSPIVSLAGWPDQILVISVSCCSKRLPRSLKEDSAARKSSSRRQCLGGIRFNVFSLRDYRGSPGNA